MDSSKIQKIFYDNSISKVVVEDYIRNFDLTIQYLSSKGIFGYNKNKELVTLFEFDNSSDIINNLNDRTNYINTILDFRSKKFMNINNFCFNKDGTRIATKDFRILVDDTRGAIPREEQLHIISVATLMLSGIIEYPIGCDFIKTKMKKYGLTDFIYQENGYLHIKIDKKEDITKGTGKLQDPKS